MDCLRTLIAGVLLSALVGCGGGTDAIVVTGTVTEDDKPLNHALVTFLPQGETSGLGGAGKTGSDGKYTLTPSRGGKGIAPGEYKVTISRLLRPDGSEADPKVPPIESDARETLPAIYSNREQTTLHATVSKEAKVHNFSLKRAPEGR